MFADVSARLNRGDHIGLVGPNGVGKTTLLRLLLGELEPTAGGIARSPALRIGYLPQTEDYPDKLTVFSEVSAGMVDLHLLEREIRRLESEIAAAEKDDSAASAKLYTRYAEASDRYQLLGGATAEARVAGILDGLDVPRRLWDAPMSTLSGGERNIVGLARILVQEHDLLLLDEPGNHLDFTGLDWLEKFLAAAPQAFIVVSHNRYLLDKVCTQIWELERNRLEQFTGNYSQYRSEKLTRQMRAETAYQRAQKEISRLQFNIQRLKAWSSVYDSPKLARTAKVFERRVAELETMEKPRGDGRRLRFRLLAKPPEGTIALEANDYRKQFPDEFILIENVNLLITQGERVALVGDNGTGKSSFLKDVVSEGRWENQNLRVGKSVTVGYYAQLGETLEPKASVLDNCMRLTGLQRGPASELLHRFLFTRDDLEKYVVVLSGGEQARLQLAILVHSGAGMLLLDEPTNHLDIPSREAVEDALEEYPGTLVVASHDRYFIDKIADRIYLFQPPSVTAYEGNFSDFWEKQRSAVNNQPSAVSHQPSAVSRRLLTRSPKQKTEAENRKPRVERLKFNPQRFKELEGEIAALENTRKEVMEELRKFEEKGKESRAETRRTRLKKIDLKLESLYAEWVTLGEKKKKW